MKIEQPQRLVSRITRGTLALVLQGGVGRVSSSSRIGAPSPAYRLVASFASSTSRFPTA